MGPAFHGDALKHCQNGRENVVKVCDSVIECSYIGQYVGIDGHVSAIVAFVELEIHSWIAVVARCTLSDSWVAEPLISFVDRPMILTDNGIESWALCQEAPIVDSTSPQRHTQNGEDNEYEDR